MRTIAVVNQKGGVGKTTVATNLAASLVEAGESVLLVDLDPQGYTTAGVGFEASWDASGTNLASALMRGSGEVEDLIAGKWEGVSVIGSNVELFVVEAQLYTVRGREHRLAHLLNGCEKFGWCLIDCPASLGVLTDNALVAAQHVLVPIAPDGLSIRALELLGDQLTSVHESLGVGGNLLGLVANAWDDTRVASEVLSDVELALDVPVLGKIRRRVGFRRAWELHQSILVHEPRGHGAVAYRLLAEALIQEVGR